MSEEMQTIRISSPYSITEFDGVYVCQTTFNTSAFKSIRKLYYVGDSFFLKTPQYRVVVEVTHGLIGKHVTDKMSKDALEHQYPDLYVAAFGKKRKVLM